MWTNRPNEEESTSWIYLILCHSPTRIPRPIKAHNLGFTTTHSLDQGLLAQWLYHDPQSVLGTTRPCVFHFLDPFHSTLNPFKNTTQLEYENPSEQDYQEMERLGWKKLSHIEKPMP